MPPTKSAGRSATSAPGVKLFITAASLAATVGGWALISAEESVPLPAPNPPVATLTTATRAAPVVSIKFDPLPTLVPQPTRQTQVAAVNTRPAATTSNSAQAVAQPLAPAALPALRVVGIPDSGGGGSAAAPAAAATTRSSK